MKSAYELAMERLTKTAPATKLTAAQKAEIAELETKCKAGIAAREIASQEAIAQAAAAGDFEKVEQMQQQLQIDRKKLQAELEDKKAAVRRG